MSLATRFANLFRSQRLSREIDEELAAHLAEAAAQGRDSAEARRALGSPLRLRESSRDIRLIPWLDSLRADAVFGWRQLRKRPVTSAAAILSLALGIGACAAAFRLIDALLLRPLPVAHPERLYAVAFEGVGAEGKLMVYDSCSSPMFRRMRAAVQDRAELFAVSYADHVDLTFGSEAEMEKADMQYVSGWMFGTLSIHPALGRLLTSADDQAPGGSPVAVLSYNYWNTRFGRDPRVLGRTFHMRDALYQIVGVAQAPFTGTETGLMTDIFVPMAMKNPVTLASPYNFWLRTLVELKPGVSPEPLRDQLAAVFHTIKIESLKDFPGMPRHLLKNYFRERLLLEPASAGRSNLQRDYRRSLAVIAILVALVLLIACANVANLMTAHAAARAREMALRVSIGAGRGRLVQLVMVECVWLAFLATALGAAFAWWSAPVILGMIRSARLALPFDWRTLAFSVVLALAVTLLFGLAPALRASAIQPAEALRGGADDPRSRRLMRALIVVQVAFCFVVHFVAGLFTATLDRLSNQPTGISAARIVNLETVTSQPAPRAYWDQVADHLRSVPGVERVSLTTWPLMSGESAGGNISIGGAPPSEVFCDFLNVSPGWFDTMKIPILNGRDFLPTDSAGVAIVNRAFARQYFKGEDPTGRPFERVDGDRTKFLIVGYVPDARSRDNLRRPILPTVYVPFWPVSRRGTFVVRTAASNPLALASVLRAEVPRARSEFRVTNIRSQVEIQEANTVRERLLAMMALFFAIVALALAGVGLYGVLDYSVVRRRREIGIRMAIGARPAAIARNVSAEIFPMVLLGSLAGLALGLLSARYLESLIFGVRANDLAILMLPSLTILALASVAALPGVIRAVRIDPADVLRME